MAKFIKSKFRVLWGTVFAFFYGFFASDAFADDHEGDMKDEGSSVEEKDAKLSPGAIAAAVAAAAAAAGAGRAAPRGCLQ